MYGAGEGQDVSKGVQVYGSGGLQGVSVEPAYKKTKLAHLRVKVPGGVRTSLNFPHPPPLSNPTPPPSYHPTYKYWCMCDWLLYRVCIALQLMYVHLTKLYRD